MWRQGRQSLDKPCGSGNSALRKMRLSREKKKKGSKMKIIKKEIDSFSLITLKISLCREQFLCPSKLPQVKGKRDSCKHRWKQCRQRVGG